VDKTYRVIQWTPGFTGKQTMRNIIDHPNLELAGLWVHSPDKAGTDAGDFCGVGPVGVVASSDVDEVLSIDADCVCYTATDVRRDLNDLVDDICRMLASGKNVVGTPSALGHPAMLGDEVVQKLTDACEAGGASFCATGINPVGAQAILATMASMCKRVESTYVCEIVNLEDYDAPEVLLFLGYGRTAEEANAVDLAYIIEYLMGPSLHLVADWFGMQIDEVRFEKDLALAPKDIELPCLFIPEGTVQGVRFNLDGLIDGKCRVTEAGCYWAGPYPTDWEPPPGNGGYKIAIKGDPDMQVEFAAQGHPRMYAGPLAKERSTESFGTMGAFAATAARAVNSIPALCEAEPGIQVLGDQSPLLPPVDWRTGGRGDLVGAVFGDARRPSRLI
jgi:hypothetical protein